MYPQAFWNLWFCHTCSQIRLKDEIAHFLTLNAVLTIIISCISVSMEIFVDMLPLLLRWPNVSAAKPTYSISDNCAIEGAYRFNFPCFLILQLQYDVSAVTRNAAVIAVFFVVFVVVTYPWRPWFLTATPRHFPPSRPLCPVGKVWPAYPWRFRRWRRRAA